MVAAALFLTYRPHWQMNVAMWMRKLYGRQNYTNAIDSGQCYAVAAAAVVDVDVAATADAAAVVVAVASDDVAAAVAVDNGCLTFGQQPKHC